VALRDAAEYICNAMQCSQPFESAYIIESALFTLEARFVGKRDLEELIVRLGEL
jgi:hypothetical protein